MHSGVTNCEGQYAFTLPKSPERSSFYTLPPCRLLNTSNPVGALGGPALQPGQSRIFSFVGTCGVPAIAKSLSVNVTAVNPATTGNITAYAGGLGVPQSSVLSFTAGKTRGNNAILAVGGAATLSIQNNSSAAVNVIVDVNGYFK